MCSLGVPAVGRFKPEAVCSWWKCQLGQRPIGWSAIWGRCQLGELLDFFKIENLGGESFIEGNYILTGWCFLHFDKFSLHAESQKTGSVMVAKTSIFNLEDHQRLRKNLHLCRLQNSEKSYVQGLNFSRLSRKWHFLKLALFVIFCVIENLSPPTNGSPLLLSIIH